EDGSEKARQPVHGHGGGQRDALRVRQRQGLGRDLGQDQEDDRKKDRVEQRQPQPPFHGDAPMREERVAEQRGGRRGDDQSQGVGEQDSRQKAVGVGAESGQRRRRLAPLLRQVAHAQP